MIKNLSQRATAIGHLIYSLEISIQLRNFFLAYAIYFALNLNYIRDNPSIWLVRFFLLFLFIYLLLLFIFFFILFILFFYIIYLFISIFIHLFIYLFIFIN